MTHIIKLIIISALLWATQAQANPLFDAIEKGDNAEFVRLVENGPDIHARDEDGATALHKAAYGDRSEAITTLLETGADIHARDEDGYTPLRVAARYGHIEVVKELLKAGVDVERDTWFDTPLHDAAYRGHSEVVKALIEAGVNVNATNGFKYTPLHFAAHAARSEAIALLLDAGANASLQDRKGRTPFDMIKEDSPLYKSSVWWRLFDVQFNGPQK